MSQLPSDPISPLTTRERLAEWLTQAQFIVYSALVVSLILIGFLWHRMFIMIPPGHLGVMYRTLNGGTETERIWGEGLHVIPPWNQMTSYEVRLQQETLRFNVLSDEGLLLGVQVVVRFRPNDKMLGYLQRDIGPDYFNRLIRPEIEAHVRRTFGNRPAHEIYATVRDVMQELGQFPLIGWFQQTGSAAETRPYVQVQDVKLVIIELPKVVETAIVEKYHQEQLMLAYNYKLERESKEADRKRTEAAGIRDFNHIVGKDAEVMLRWRNLEVASEFAKAPNSKVVVLGGGQGGSPMIMNLGDTSPGTLRTEPPEPATVKSEVVKPTGAQPAAPKPPQKVGDNAPPAGPPDAASASSGLLRTLRALVP